MDAIPNLGDEKYPPSEPYGQISTEFQADYNAWVEQVSLPGNEVCEQAFETEGEHYQFMGDLRRAIFLEEEADQKIEDIISDIMEGYDPPNQFRLHEHINDLGGEQDPRWSEDEQIRGSNQEAFSYDVDDYDQD